MWPRLFSLTAAPGCLCPPAGLVLEHAALKDGLGGCLPVRSEPFDRLGNQLKTVTHHTGIFGIVHGNGACACEDRSVKIEMHILSAGHSRDPRRLAPGE
jgi:hypothetical protein